MEKQIKIVGVKKAVGEAKRWTEKRNGNIANIMLDTETGKVWTDVFTDCNSYINYKTKSIKSVGRLLMENSLEMTMKNVKEVCLELLEMSQIFKYENEIVSEEEFEKIEESGYVIKVENCGCSSVELGYTYYNVILTTGEEMSIYFKQQEN